MSRGHGNGEQRDSIGDQRAGANERLSGAIRLRLGGSDLIDYSAVRVKKRQTRDPVGCDL